MIDENLTDKYIENIFYLELEKRELIALKKIIWKHVSRLYEDIRNRKNSESDNDDICKEYAIYNVLLIKIKELEKEVIL